MPNWAAKDKSWSVLTLTSVLELSFRFRGSNKRHNSIRDFLLCRFGYKDFDTFSKFMKMSLPPWITGGLLLSLCSLFIPIAHVQFLPSVTSLIRKTGQSTSSLSPRCKRVSLSISVSFDWQLIQSVFLPSILNRTCLLPANFKIQFKFYSWHAFGPKSEKKKRKQTEVKHETLDKSSIYIPAVWPLIPWIRGTPGWALHGGRQWGDEAFCSFTSVHMVTQHSGGLARQHVQTSGLRCSIVAPSAAASLYATLRLAALSRSVNGHWLTGRTTL